MSNQTQKIKEFFRTFSLTERFYFFLAEIKKYFILTIQKRRLQKKGIELISQIQQFLHSKNYFFYFDMGTLLGIVREGHLLKHDLDIDIAIKLKPGQSHEKLHKELCEAGYRMTARLRLNETNLLIEESYHGSGIKFDISYYFTEFEQDICYLLYDTPETTMNTMKAVQLTAPTVKHTVLFPFQGVKVNVPENPEHYLMNRYGANWKIPDRNYVYWKGPSTHPTEYHGTKEEF